MRPWPAGWSARCTSPTTCCRPHSELARSFVVDRSPVALGLAKQLHLPQRRGRRTRSRRTSSDSLAMFHASVGDGKEGVAAFREKRSPVFTGLASELPEIF